MSVFTTFLVVATCLLFYANGAPNKKADEGHPRANKRFRQNVPYQADEALFTNSVPIAITGLLPNGVVTGLATFSTSSGIPSVIGNTGSAASAGAGFPPSGLGTGLSPFPIPPGMFYGTSNTASIYGSGSSSGFVPFPTQGAPYQNFTAPYIQPSSLPSLAVPAVNIPTETGVRNSGQGDSSAQCPPPQTVTLPPQIITLPAETATVTAAPQTITQTITITPQIQTQAVTITVTVTAGPAPAYSKAGDAGSPQNLPAAAPSNFPTLAASNAPAGIVPPANAGLGNGGIGTQGSGSQGASIPGIQPPAQTGGPALGSGQPAAPVHPAGTSANNNGVAMPSVTGPVLGSGAAPVLPAATSANKNGIATPTAVLSVVTSTINLVPVPSAVLPAPVNTPASPNQGQNSVASQPAPGPPPSNIPSIQSPAQITNVPGLMPSGNVPISPVTNSSILGQAPSVPPSPPPIAPYPFQNSTGPSNVRGPSGIGSIGSIPSIGPTGSGFGFAGPTSGPTAPFQPIRPPPQDISSIQPPPFQANASVTPPQAGTTAQITPPVSLNSSQPLSANVTSSINLGPVHPFTGLPPNPTLQPSSPLNISAQEAPPLSTTNTDSTCSTNGTSSQNITANYDDLKPFTTPLFYLGLNYTSFLLSSYPGSSSSPPHHIRAFPSSTPKTISVSPPFLSFSLKSVYLNCGDGLSPESMCTVQIAGLGVPSSIAMESNGGKPVTGMFRTVKILGRDMKRFEFDETWRGLSKVTFSAEAVGMGTEMGVGVDDLQYEVLSAC